MHMVHIVRVTQLAMPRAGAVEAKCVMRLTLHLTMRLAPRLTLRLTLRLALRLTLCLTLRLIRTGLELWKRNV